MGDPAKQRQFEVAVLSHLDAAYNLARWMLREEAAAEDAVQEASLRAFRFFAGMHGASPKAWFLAVVRNTCLDRIRDDRQRSLEDEYDDKFHLSPAETPEAAADRSQEARWLHDCIRDLPFEYREAIVLRELEELSYKEISMIVEIPIGTVMSRLSRGRDMLQQRLLATRARKRS
ncbi:MAG: sigma-70 family RNA polymerase sigma factor [Candidatus Parcubacteria bacterium]|nr:sigma-70 family RNA polymerase sigma factor [Burkholderiales bacterium]